MALRDLEAFMRQRASDFDPGMDVTEGSPFDTKVVQPLLRRTGIDPFTVDLITYLNTRIKQAYPKLASENGDNITDLIIKPNALLWDPIVREITRVKRNQSFADPSTLTLEEADALGALFFTPRRKGKLARGVGRLLFGNPQNISVSPNNFCTSRAGLVFYPSETQGIRTEEMLLNVSGSNYYFDVNLVAADVGASYNIDPNELVSVANLPSVVRVTNLNRFFDGDDEEDVAEFVQRIEQELGEKSLVTLRGIAAKILDSFQEVTRLNVVGFNDPEMQRDVIKGGGLGGVLAAGTSGSSVSDTEAKVNTRRFYTSEVDFTSLIDDSGTYVLTILGAFGTAVTAKDIEVLRVIDSSTVDLVDQDLTLGLTGLSWTLRKRELTISDIPGGILFPDGPNGTVTIPDDEVHVGGMYDVHTRTRSFEEATLIVDNVTDDSPLLDGTQLTAPTTSTVQLNELALGTDYEEGDTTYEALEAAVTEAYSLQIQSGPNAGTYRVLSVTHSSGSPVVLGVTPVLAATSAIDTQWRLFDAIDINLIEPKETRVTGDDLVTVQGSDVVTTSSGTDLDSFGVSEGDVLRITEGVEAGDYTIVADPITPSTLRIDRGFPRSLSGTSYTIFRPNDDTLLPPLVRIKSIELLDSSSQPQGSYVPYAKPVDVQSRAFQNPARGVKHSFTDTRLGLLSKEFTTVDVGTGGTLEVYVGGLSPAKKTVTLTITGTVTLAQVIADLNTLLQAATTFPEMVVQVGTNRFGIRPTGNGFIAVVGGTVMTALFGSNELRTTADVRSAEVEAQSGWQNLDPVIDTDSGLDVLQVIDGGNIGFYGGPFLISLNLSSLPDFSGTTLSTALIRSEDSEALIDGSATYFSPEVRRQAAIGARSIGSVRVYFLEPTTFEATADTVFTLDTGESGDANFIPDPTLSHQILPALPDGTSSSEGDSSNGSDVFTDATVDFQLSGVLPGDVLEIEYFPLEGTKVLSNPVDNLVSKTFVFSLDGGVDQTLTFIRDDVSLNSDQVSRAGVAAQINAKAGRDICEVTALNILKFSTDVSLIIRAEGTSNDLILDEISGYTPVTKFSEQDTSNTSPHAGQYDVLSVSGSVLTLTENVVESTSSWGSSISSQTYKVYRSGIQRITATEMAENEGDADLYYFDVELVSEGTGDFWNIDSDQQLTVTGYKSDGYYLTTDDSNTTFSDAEVPRLVISRTILEQGVDDDPQNATQVTGQNIQVTYERAPSITNIQNFIASETERVVCANPLSRHLVPYFVRFDLTYTGGSKESVVTPDVEKYIRNLYPNDTLDASDVQKIPMDRGANYVQNPLDLIAVVHRVDRTIWVERSRDRLSTSRLSAFIPDVLNITRNLT